MAEPNQIIPDNFDPPEVVVTAFRDEYYVINEFMNHNLLRSCKFAIRLDRHPNILQNFYKASNLRQFSLLCDSIEFPGRSILTTDFNIPGKQKIRTPYKREFNEITLTFYHNTKFPMYEYFTTWEDEISSNSSRTRYFSDIVTDINLFQFYDTTSSTFLPELGGSGTHVKYPQMKVTLLNAYPVSVASLPSNWADDGYHKITATFFYEETLESQSTSVPGLSLKNLDVIDNVNSPATPPTSIDQYLQDPRRFA